MKVMLRINMNCKSFLKIFPLRQNLNKKTTRLQCNKAQATILFKNIVLQHFFSEWKFQATNLIGKNVSCHIF